MSALPVAVAWTDPLPDDLEEAALLLGGKGLSLLRIRGAGLEIPRGFTLTNRAFHQFRENNNSLTSRLRAEIDRALANLEQDLGRQLGTGAPALLVAVRSGASVSMPGTMSTILNCGLTLDAARESDCPSAWGTLLQFVLMTGKRGSLTVSSGIADGSARDRCLQMITNWEREWGRPFPDSPRAMLYEAVEAVFRSWDGVQAREFRRLNGVSEDLGTAVTVQEMFPAALSGVALTDDPGGPGSGTIVIEAVAGLGESLVSGRATPFRWLVRATGVESSRPDANGASISAPVCAGFEAGVLPQLCDACRRLRQIWGGELEIEWGARGTELMFFQARPLEAAPSISEIRQRRRRLIGAAAEHATERTIWVRHSIQESLPHPSPLTWSILAPFLSGRGGLGRVYRQLGYSPAPRIMESGFLDLVAGRPYADIARLPELFCTGWPFHFDVEELRSDPEGLERGPRRLDLAQSDGRLLFRLPHLALVFWRSRRRIASLAPCAADDFLKRTEPALRAYVAEEACRNLGALDQQTLIAVFEQRRRRVLDEFAPDLLLPGTIAGAECASLESDLERWCGAEQARLMTGSYLAAIPDPLVLRQRDLLRELGNHSDGGRFLEEFGHRALGEMELSVPRWREIPDLLARFGQHPDGPSRKPLVSSQPDLDRDVAGLRLREELALAGGSCLAPRLDTRLALIRELLPLRERGRHLLMLGYELLRQVLEELRARWGLGGLIYYLHWEEVERGCPGAELKALAMRRHRDWREARALPMPAVIDTSRLDELDIDHVRTHGVGAHAAVPISPGRGGGPAIFLDESAPAVQRAGGILVVDSLDPGVLPWLAQSAGAVVEQGGALSHGAILARQLQIPVVRLPEARRILAGAARIDVDADAGWVRRPERPS